MAAGAGQALAGASREAARFLEHSSPAEGAVARARGDSSKKPALHASIAAEICSPSIQGATQQLKLQDGCLGRAPAHKSSWRGASPPLLSMACTPSPMQPKLSLPKRSPRASRRPKNQPAAVYMHARCSPASAIASIAHTHPPRTTPHRLLETQANSSTASSAPAPRLMY